MFNETEYLLDAITHVRELLSEYPQGPHFYTCCRVADYMQEAGFWRPKSGEYLEMLLNNPFRKFVDAWAMKQPWHNSDLSDAEKMNALAGYGVPAILDHKNATYAEMTNLRIRMLDEAYEYFSEK